MENAWIKMIENSTEYITLYRSKLTEARNELKKIVIESFEKNEEIQVSISGERKIISLLISEKLLALPIKEKIEARLVDSINCAIEKTNKIIIEEINKMPSPHIMGEKYINPQNEVREGKELLMKELSIELGKINSILVTIKSSNGEIDISMSGSQMISSLHISRSMLTLSKKANLEQKIIKVFNDAIETMNKEIINRMVEFEKGFREKDMKNNI